MSEQPRGLHWCDWRKHCSLCAVDKDSLPHRIVQWMMCRITRTSPPRNTDGKATPE